MTKELLPLFGENLDRTISTKPAQDYPLPNILTAIGKQPTLAIAPILKHASEHLNAIIEAKSNKNNALLESLLEISKEDLGFEQTPSHGNDLKARAKNKNKTQVKNSNSNSSSTINKFNKPKPKFA